MQKRRQEFEEDHQIYSQEMTETNEHMPCVQLPNYASIIQDLGNDATHF